MDKKLRYNEQDWQPQNIKNYIYTGNNLDNCDPYCFIEAALNQCNYVLNELLFEYIPEKVKNGIERSESHKQKFRDAKEELTGKKDEVFICYSREQKKFALKLAQELKDHGVKIWIDLWNLEPGENFDVAIDKALYRCDKLLAIVSKASVESDEVSAEIRLALDERKPIVPVKYEDCKMPRHLRVKQYIDWSTDDMDENAKFELLFQSFDAA